MGLAARIREAPPGPGVMFDGVWYAGDVPEIVMGLESAGFTVELLGPSSFRVTSEATNPRTVTLHPASP